MNLLHGTVLAIGFIGAILAKLQPLDMARAMSATAAIQFAVPFVALLIKQPELTMGVLWMIVLNTIFLGLWALLRWLFRRVSIVGANLGRQSVA